MTHSLNTECLLDPNHDLLQRFLHVCKFSGFRHLGVAQRVQGNKELLRCLLAEKAILTRWSWIPAYGFAVSAFFQEVEHIQHIVHNRAPAQNTLCGKFLQGLTGKSTKKLLHLQRTNRKFMGLIRRHKAVFCNVEFIESWLADHELFFEDLKNAFWNVRPAENLPEWVGSDYTPYLLKFDACQQFEFFDEERGAS